MSVTVDVTSGGTPTRFTMVLDEVRSVRIDRAVPLPWEHAELTEIHVSHVPEGVTVEIVIWDDATGLTVSCSRMSVSAAA